MPGERDFDFLLGDWSVGHRKLRERLVGSTNWDEFGGSVRVRPILGGMGNYDDNVLAEPTGRHAALTLRRHDPKKDNWSIWWVDARMMRLEPPVVGGFARGVGTFHGDDELRGKRIRVRFIWSEITPNSARWEQAFSSDSGGTWEVNWIMHFHREQAT